MSQRRKFDKEFKLMAVELSKNREDISQGAGYPGRAYLSLAQGVFGKEYWKFSGHGKAKQTPEEAEIARLKKALRDAEMERDGAALAS